jgi:hypothetical protein
VFDRISYALQNARSEGQRIRAWAELKAYASVNPDNEDVQNLLNKYQKLDRDWRAEVRSTTER